MFVICAKLPVFEKQLISCRNSFSAKYQIINSFDLKSAFHLIAILIVIAKEIETVCFVQTAQM